MEFERHNKLENYGEIIKGNFFFFESNFILHSEWFLNQNTENPNSRLRTTFPIPVTLRLNLISKVQGLSPVGRYKVKMIFFFPGVTQTFKYLSFRTAAKLYRISCRGIDSLFRGVFFLPSPPSHTHTRS